MHTVHVETSFTLVVSEMLKNRSNPSKNIPPCSPQCARHSGTTLVSLRPPAAILQALNPNEHHTTGDKGSIDLRRVSADSSGQG